MGPVDYVIWFVVTLVHLFCLACVIRKRALSQHFTIVLFLTASIAIGVSRYVIMLTSGLSSTSYFYFYYYSDAVLTICLFFVLMSFYSQVFSEMGVAKIVRAAAMHMVASSSERLLSRFAYEMSQNLYFVGVVLTYVLWGAMMKMQENRTRLIQLVLGLGVFLSAFAGSYALRNMYPDHMIWRFFIHIMAVWLPASWSYTFLKVPEEARMATAQVVSPASR